MHLIPGPFRYARRALLSGGLGVLHHHRGHRHVSKAISRRQFLGTAAGAAGLLFGAGLVSPARAAVCADPKPIPGGFAEFGHFYHQLYPNQDTADTEDPSTTTDFNGHIGLAYVEGMGTHTDKTTGRVRHLPFRVDLRFMQGVYVGKDGQPHYGAFGAL
jgi:hypothetical protein